MIYDKIYVNIKEKDMMIPVKTLKEIEEEIQEDIRTIKKLIPENGYYVNSIQKRNETIHVEIANRAKKKIGHFKSRKGYDTKYKNKKQFASHYGEYIAYLILKQLSKKVCKMELGEVQIRNKYSLKIMHVEGVLSYYEKEKNKDFRKIKSIVENYAKDYPEEYKKMVTNERLDSKRNYSNIEIILKSLDILYRKNGQADKIPQMRKDFFDMCMFDLIFANRDRNDENFGVEIDQLTNEIEFYPLFDNEQILGMQEEKKDVIRYMSSEKEYKKFKEQYLTSHIGIPTKVQAVDPCLFLTYLLENYYEETMTSFKDIERYTFSHLEQVLEVCSGLSEEHKDFAKKIFLERQEEIADTIKRFEEKKVKRYDEWEIDL